MMPLDEEVVLLSMTLDEEDVEVVLMALRYVTSTISGRLSSTNDSPIAGACMKFYHNKAIALIARIEQSQNGDEEEPNA